MERQRGSGPGRDQASPGPSLFPSPPGPAGLRKQRRRAGLVLVALHRAGHRGCDPHDLRAFSRRRPWGAPTQTPALLPTRLNRRAPGDQGGIVVYVPTRASGAAGRWTRSLSPGPFFPDVEREPSGRGTGRFTVTLTKARGRVRRSWPQARSSPLQPSRVLVFDPSKARFRGHGVRGQTSRGGAARTLSPPRRQMTL